MQKKSYFIKIPTFDFSILIVYECSNGGSADVKTADVFPRRFAHFVDKHFCRSIVVVNVVVVWAWKEKKISDNKFHLTSCTCLLKRDKLILNMSCPKSEGISSQSS